MTPGGGNALYDSLPTRSSTRSGPARRRTPRRHSLDARQQVVHPFSRLKRRWNPARSLPSLHSFGLIPAGAARSARTLDPVRTRFLTLTSRAEEEGRKLASVSGGVYYPVTRLDQLQRAYDDVVAQLRTAYTITYASNAAATGSDARASRVRVRVNTDGASVRLSPSVSVAAP